MKRKLAVILSALIITSAMFTGCGCENRTATADEAAMTTVSAETKPQTSDTTVALDDTALDKEEQSAVQEAGLKVDSKGNITDKDGNKVEVKDGKIEIKDENGKTVEVSVDTVKTVNNNTASTNKTSGSSNTGKKPSSSSSTTSKPNSSSSGSSGSSSKPGNSSSSSSTANSNKTWHEAVYKTINHPAETEKVWVVDKEAYTYEEPVYEEQGRYICNDCGADITDNVLHIFEHIENDPNCKGSYRVKVVKVQVGTKTVEVPEQGHWETKVIKEAWTEKVLVKEAGYY